MALSTHPPLARRIVALDPRFGTVRDYSQAGTVRALAILGAVSFATLAVIALGVSKLPALLRSFNPAMQVAEAEEPYTPPAFEVGVADWSRGVERLSSLIGAALQQGGTIPADYLELEQMAGSASGGADAAGSIRRAGPRL